MVYHQCAKCGGTLEPLGDGRTAMCIYCNAVMVLPTVHPDTFNHANELRLKQDFDQAEMAFERIVSENPEDCDAYWNLVLCRYGIEYVEDRDGSRVPTCHRMSYQSILEDPDYRKALEYADPYSARIYRAEAEKIDRVLKRAAQIAQSQPEYDIFISYKETDEQGHRTEDSAIAREIYDALMERCPGLNIFLSRITLAETAAGLEYEPVIFSALNTAKVMILVGTSRENLESAWVRNEWSRFRRMMDKDTGKKMAVVYRDMDLAADFPPELRLLSIQATEAAGFYLHDFVAGMETLLDLRREVSGPAPRSSVDQQVEDLLQQAEQAMAAKDGQEARRIYQETLDVKADCAAAWWGLLRVETKDLRKINEKTGFELSKEAAADWRMVERYAASDEKAAYQAKLDDYRARWTAANDQWRCGQELKSSRQRLKDGMEEMRRATGDGTVFSNYAKYHPDGIFVRELRQGVPPEELEELDAFRQKYRQNYEKFCQFQDLKQSAPEQAIRKEAEYLRLVEEKDAAQTALDKAKSRLNGMLGFNVCFAGIIVLLTWWFSSPDRRYALTLSYHLIPLLVSVLIINTAGIILYRKHLEDSGFANELVVTMFGFIFSLIGYFVIQFFIVKYAQQFDPTIAMARMFSGIVGFLVPVGGIGLIVLIFMQQWVFAVLFAIVVFGFAGVLQICFNVYDIPPDILRLMQAELFHWLLIAALVCLAVRVLMWLLNKHPMTMHKAAQGNLNRKEYQCEHYVKARIKELCKPFEGHVADRYLEEIYPAPKEKKET